MKQCAAFKYLYFEFFICINLVIFYFFNRLNGNFIIKGQIVELADNMLKVSASNCLKTNNL